MRRLRRTAIAAVCFTLGAAVVATPGWAAAPPPGARPDVVNSADDARPGQTVPKDAKGRSLVYVEGPRADQLKAAVLEAGGSVSGEAGGRVKAAVPKDKLDAVASRPGVTEVRLPDRAVPMAITSEGVAAAKANLWHDAGKKGAGVKVGIIDVGFGNVAASQAAGELPANITINNDNCLDAAEKPQHGTGIAEIVHDVAPEAQLFLACIEDTFSFDQAETWLRAQGVQVISSAVGFLAPAGSRGDGTGDAGSPAEVVKRSRQAGILWSVAAGNQARQHYAGKAIDSDGDGWVEFGISRQNGFPLDPGATATVGLRWDAWPKTKQDLDLYISTAQDPPPTGLNDPNLVAVSTRSQKDTPEGLAPTESVTLRNTSGATRTYWVFVKNHNAALNTPMELFVNGLALGQQLQQYTEAGSIVEPATSPHVIAVGATQPGSGRAQDYSSRGPTIDGRQKPDITGYDQVSTKSMLVMSGTSAATAHVAGAAALFKSASPGLDAGQLQTALQNAANPKQSNNTWGNGPLSVGAPSTAPTAPNGSGFTVLQQQYRVHGESYAANEVKTLTFGDLPTDTKSVAITVSARATASDIGDFAIEVAPGDPAQLGGKVPTLNARGDTRQTWQSLTMFAPLDNARSLKVRHRGNGPVFVVVELLGYFSPQNSTDTYFAKPKPERVLDTRGFQVVSGGSDRNTPLRDTNTTNFVDLQIRGVAGVPQSARAVALNLTGFEATAESFLVAHHTSETLSYTSIAVSPGDRRTNLVIVPIGADGKIRLTNNSATVVGAALDVVGWFGPDSGGARYVPLTGVSRVADTATGNGLPKAQVGHGQVATFQVSGVADVPASATSAAVLMTGRDDNLGTELSAVASEVGWTSASQVSTRKMETATGLALVPLGNSGKVDVRNERGQTRLTADVMGYFVGGTKVAVPAVAGNCVTAKDGPGFYSAFDGRRESDLEGWQSTGTKIGTDGCELVTKDGVDVSWYSAHTYGNDYTMKIDWKATTDNSDSGVFVLMNNPGTNSSAPHGSGYEVNIGPRNATGTLQTGGFSGIQAPTTTAPVKPTGEWNTFEIKVRWNTATVYLNGQQVNEYTSADSTGVARNTFIGLQNDGANDSVRFRNIRIKRDTPVFSGTLKGVNGRCLDVKESNPFQPVVQMWDCHGLFAQTWTSNEGLLMAGGRCLTASDPGGDGASVVLAGCAGIDGQQWVLRTDGRLISRYSGRCATPNDGNQGSQLVLRACDKSRSDQVWQVPAQNGRAGKVVGAAGKCLDVPNNDPTLNKVVLWPCNGSPAQSFAAPGDGTLRADGKCIDLANSNTAEGSAVILYECNGTQAQQWVAQPEGSLVNPLSGRCLTVASSADSSTLSISNCAGTPTQTWSLTAEWLSRGAIVGVATKCIDVYGNDPNASRLWLWECFGPTGQLWWAPGDGTFRIYGKCLDIGDTVNGTAIVNAGCHGGTSQQWTARHDGSLVSALAGRCVDDVGYSSANGNPLAIYNCTRDWNQRWATPVNPS
ncbi:ricin-type beta-trefoil lectin domain protein [Lentzea aerocolonigenes]|uniref:ricin-type beta-trefoil lectin domain protein n=1 Tax=Lentzea aerocolonigenes TaxID=68170 RepID=UPI000B29D044|nr:ricin-type beta-trefoil lectin domain protein [Lentzea aerocolonigenes]MCP2243160.1 Subtilase family protein [Lentzea aerocolonigenes]